jgi:hypothetical protein
MCICVWLPDASESFVMTNSPKMAPSAPANEVDQPAPKQNQPKVEAAPLKPAEPAETKKI